MNRQYLDPAIHGRYPSELAEMFGEAWPDWPAVNFDLIRQPLDFLGVNYYTRNVTRADDTFLLKAGPVAQKNATVTTTGWEVFPQGLTDMLVWVKQNYGDVPLYVTENGAAFYDPPKPIDGKVDDPLRVEYLRAHIAAVGEAIRRGVDVRGYMLWSLLDNLEWSLGYSKRFGMVHVDFETQARTPKASAHFYSEVIRTNGGNLG
jgi:beta-glucosidase